MNKADKRLVIMVFMACFILIAINIKRIMVFLIIAVLSLIVAVSMEKTNFSVWIKFMKVIGTEFVETINDVCREKEVPPKTTTSLHPSVWDA